jgi:Ca2+-binding EF-hand superfamily protein
MSRMISRLGFVALSFAMLAGSGAVRAQQTQRDLPGPIDSLQDLQDTGKMLFKLADENNDGQISQKEAVDAGNLMIGGLFFRADANGDGALEPQEMQAAREEILREKPMLNIFLQRMRAQNAAQANNTANAARGAMSLLDSNNNGKIEAAELRQLVATSVQSAFAATDTNRDGQLSPTEVNAAIVGAARSAAQAAFQRADSDGNGQLSQQEFIKALDEPASTVFKVVDANNDGQLSPQEAQAAARMIGSQLRSLNVPEAPNSARNLIRSGRTPAQVAPVPSIPVPNAATVPGTQPAPVPGTQPAPVPVPVPVQPR